MEAFILADRVLTAEHMQPRSHCQLKYLKRYDRSPSSPPPKTASSPQKHYRIQQKNSQPHASRTKHLLCLLLQKNREELHPSKYKFEKYFRAPSSKENNMSKISKKPLIIKNIEPQRQPYDANFDSVCPRMPSWGFTPESTATSELYSCANPTKNSQKLGKCRSTRGYKRPPDEQRVLEQASKRAYYQQLRGRCVQVEGLKASIQYSAQQLGRCTSQIFKKHHLDKDPYFKKFLSELPQ